MESALEKNDKLLLKYPRIIIRNNVTKDQIISFGYTEEEFAEAENAPCINT